MNLHKSFALVLTLFALVCNPSKTFSAETPKKSNNQPSATPVPVKKALPVETRYRATADFVSLERAGFTQSKYSGPATLNGLGLKSASELGIAGKSIYNEYERSARVVVLAPSAQVYYDTGSLEPLYLAGCMIDGKPSANRIRLLEPLQKVPEEKPVPVATPAPTPVITATPEPKKVAPVVKVKQADSGYDPEFYSARGRVAVVPAVRLLTRAAIVDIPIPTPSANGRPLDGQPLGNPNQGNPQRPKGRPQSQRP